MTKKKHKKKVSKRPTRSWGKAALLIGANIALALLVVAGIAHAYSPKSPPASGRGAVVIASPSQAPTPTPTPMPASSPVATYGPVPPPAQTVVPTPKPPWYQQPRYVAHAGGLYLGQTYTNSVAALDHSYQAGYRLLEVDLNLTSDGQIVLLHDWGPTVENIFGITQGQRDLQTFLSDTANSKYHPAQLTDLANWARAHPGAKVILDSKTNAVDMMTAVAARYPDLRSHFVPYIYSFDQFQSATNLGFANISLLTTTGQYTPSELLGFARGHHLHSIAMQSATLSAQLPELFRTVGVYCWTINSATERDRLFAAGAYGLITDSLGP